jgi:two-component system sensor histidine kinase EvgS
LKESMGNGSTQAGDAPAPLSVLLVDDHPVNRKVVEWRLRKAGHEFVSVDGGAEAVRVAGERRFDLILMDVRLPDIDGCEATRRIRESESGSAGPPAFIMALTALFMDEELAECRQAGMDDCICKPLKPGELEAAFAKARERRDGAGAAPSSGGAQ